MAKRALSLNDISTFRISPFLRAATAAAIPQEQSPQVRKVSYRFRDHGCRQIELSGWLWVEQHGASVPQPLLIYSLSPGLL